MLNNQARNCLVNTYAKFGEAEQVSQAFGVTKWTVYKLSKQMELTGSVELRTSTRGRKSKIEEYHSKKILEMLSAEPDLTLDEIRRHRRYDNLSVHKKKDVEKIINRVGAKVKYLPPCSPDFNPIEMMWSKMKSHLRKWKIRLKEFLPAAIDKALSYVCPADYFGWFSACNYC